MMCPNCGSELSKQLLDQQDVLHCSNCGASFFEENGINRVSQVSAEKLFEDRKTDFVSNEQMLCPKDNSFLHSVERSSAIPDYVTLYKCPRCEGIFVFPQDLIDFKKAQKSKVDYLKIWNIPFSPLKSVLVLSFILAVSLSVFLGINTVQKKTSEKVKATDLLKNVGLSVNPPFYILAFQTSQPFFAEVAFLDSQKNIRLRKTVSSTPALVHIADIPQKEVKGLVYYQIILSDKQGQIVLVKEGLISEAK